MEDKRRFESPEPAILVLKISVFCLFIGRAWQHIRWDAPFRALLWNQRMMQSAVERILALEWTDYVTSPEMDVAIGALIRGFGWFYLLCAIAVLLFDRQRRNSGWVLIPGSLALVLLAILYHFERF